MPSDHENPEHLIFNENLREFGNRVGILCSLEASGKISAEDAYQQIRDLWRQLAVSKHQLLDPPPQTED